MEETDTRPRCAFCGSILIWQSDFMTEDCGYSPEGKLVSIYSCPKCGASAEFIEGGDEVND